VYGRRIPKAEMFARIDAVDADTVRAVADRCAHADWPVVLLPCVLTCRADPSSQTQVDGPAQYCLQLAVYSQKGRKPWDSIACFLCGGAGSSTTRMWPLLLWVTPSTCQTTTGALGSCLLGAVVCQSQLHSVEFGS
jgi:hypothetical protein